MKKSLVVAGAAVSAVVLGAVPTIIPSIDASVYAATGASDTASALVVYNQLRDQIKAKYPEIDKWSNLAYMIVGIESDYACTGKGCAAEAFPKLDENGDQILNDDGTYAMVYPAKELNAILTKYGKTPESMTSIERVNFLKTTSEYKDDADIKKYVDGIDADIASMINMLAESELPSAIDKSKLQNLSPEAFLAVIKATPNYDPLSKLGITYDQYTYADMPLTQINSYYDQLSYVLQWAEENMEASSPEEVKVTTNELKALVEKTKANPEYQKYEKLVRGVHEAEVLLETLKTPVNVNGKARTARNVNSKPVMTLAVAREVAAEDDATTAEIVATIKALGDAMRAVGVKTALGEGLTTANVDDLAKAIEAARGVEKFTQYEELVEAIDAAEAAIANGVTDATVLKQVLANVQQIAKKVLPPDTGVAPIENTEISAVANFSTSAVVATLATTIGAAVILKRRFANKD